MDNLEEGLRWLDQAEADLKTAKDCLKIKIIMLAPSSPNNQPRKLLRASFIQKATGLQ
jgi:hypothetical protein